MSSSSSRSSEIIKFNSSSSLSTYYVKFGGVTIETIVTKKETVANEWANEMLIKYAKIKHTDHVLVGLDSEWRPNFVKNRRPNKSATLQLCIENQCLILQLLYVDQIPQKIKTLLSDPHFIFVGVEVAKDIFKLQYEYGLVFDRSADIGELAMKKWPSRFYSRPGLKELAKEICGLDMPKPKSVCLSNWAARVLNEDQVEYACIDAYASYKIGHELRMEI